VELGDQVRAEPAHLDAALVQRPSAFAEFMRGALAESLSTNDSSATEEE
jgi:hypothetical protein